MSCSRLSLAFAAVLAAGPVSAADPPKPNTLTPKEIADGWVLLFDGETSFGWKISGRAKVQDGALVLGGPEETTAVLSTRLGAYDLRLETEGPVNLNSAAPISASGVGLSELLTRWNISVRSGADTTEITSSTKAGQDRVTDCKVTSTGRPEVRIKVRAGGTVAVRSAKLKPVGLDPLFNGKDLTGWKVFAGDPKRAATKFTVTPAGELSAKSGPGDLQTEKQFDNFVLQLECKTNGKWLNSGVFFRCLTGQYQQGYEAQIHNGYVGDDRAKPVDFGTGAVYRRVPARKVVSTDNEWFTLTVVADGPHVATWVNGYQTADWTDDRRPAENARQGLKTGPGHLSLQGHDPTTDLLFRAIRIAALPATKE